jgi:hypothetical protein
MSDDDKREPAPAPAPCDDETIDDKARDKFLNDLQERREVVPTGEDLPPGATHEVEEKDGEKVLHRRRFSAY